MRVVVAYASAHGSTREIAEAVGSRLGDAGLDVAVRPAGDVADLAGCDAVVVGSAIHDGAWLGEARGFLDRHRAELAGRPLWLFSVSSVGETTSAFGPRSTRLMRRMRRAPRAVAEARAELRPRGHRDFAGVLRPEHWGRTGSAFLRLFRGRYGDHRDWPDVRAWADDIARQLATEA